MMESISPLKEESVDDYDLSMNMNGSHENSDGYMSADQTFHTPSFGDEEFDIPPINLPPSSGSDTSSNDVYGTTQPLTHQQPPIPTSISRSLVTSSNQQSTGLPVQGPHTPCSQSFQMDRASVMTTTSSASSAVDSYGDSGQQQMYTGPSILDAGQDMYMVQLGNTNMMPPQQVHFQVQPYGIPTSYASVQMAPQHRFDYRHQVPLVPHGAHLLQQQSQQQQTQQHQQQHHLVAQQNSHHHYHPQGPLLAPSSLLALQLGNTRHQPRPASVGSSPSGSNHTSPGLETSEDSDDSGHLTQLMGGIKRPSPEPTERPPSVGKPVKKPKTQKKKKKRDPNEPQKPVSAYALFFRDTQAAIKGQNPNASFGEVSKIVASMWDGLEVDHKNVYKKKTEAAKKEYLKALAAYRASLVSKASSEQADTMYGNNNAGRTTPTSSPLTSVTNQNLSPLQKKSPLLTSLMEGTAVNTLHNMTQPQPLLASMGNMPPPHMLPQQQQQQQQHPHANGHPMLHQMLSPNGHMIHSNPHMMEHHHMQGQQQPQGGHINNNNLSYSSGMMTTSPPQLSHNGQGMMCSSPLQTYLRNPAEQQQDWERDYCNNDCVVSHCRDVFTTWVTSRPPPPNSYASVK